MPEAQIKDALIRFAAGIKDSDGNRLSGALADLEKLLAQHRAELHPQLAHFLEGRSYAKAAAFLGLDLNAGRPSSPPGGCGGGHA